MMSKRRWYDCLLLVCTLVGIGAWLAMHYVTSGYGWIQAIGFGAFVLAAALLLAEKWREAARGTINERIISSFRVFGLFTLTMSMLRNQESAIVGNKGDLVLVMGLAILMIIEWVYLRLFTNISEA